MAAASGRSWASHSTSTLPTRLPLASLAPAIDACIREGRGRVTTGTARPLQDCALALLQYDFVANEWDLLCAQPGSALGPLKTNTKSLLRFDSARKKSGQSFFADVRRADPTERLREDGDRDRSRRGGVGKRSTKRACLIPGMNADQCAREGVPGVGLRAGARRSAATRLLGRLRNRGRKGCLARRRVAECQSRFARGGRHARQSADAEYLSNFPAPRSRASRGSPRLTLGAMTTVGTRRSVGETSYAALEQHRRQRDACEWLGHLVGNESLCPATGAAKKSGLSALSSGLLTVSVPDDIAPASLFASGYTFDPLVMRGGSFSGASARSSAAAPRCSSSWVGAFPGALERAHFACPGGEGVSEAMQPAFARTNNRSPPRSRATGNMRTRRCGKSTSRNERPWFLRGSRPAKGSKSRYAVRSETA